MEPVATKKKRNKKRNKNKNKHCSQDNQQATREHVAGDPSASSLAHLLEAMNLNNGSQKEGQESDYNNDCSTPITPITLFSDCESYMNWNPTPPPDYFKLVQATQNRFSRNTVTAFCNGETTPTHSTHSVDGYFDENKRYNMFEHVSNLGALVFFYLELKDIQTADFYMEELLRCILEARTEKSIPDDYSVSFGYVVHFLCLYASDVEASLTHGTGNLFKTRLLLNQNKDLTTTIMSFDCLLPKAKAGILGIKNYYWKMIKHDYDGTLNVIRQAIELDPDYYEWHYCLQATLRSKRRKHSYHHFQPHPFPWKEERIALNTACHLAPNNPRCMVADILTLAENIKAHTKTNASSPTPTEFKVYHNGKDFQDASAVVAFIKSKAWKIIELSPTSVHVNTTIAEIFTVLLPHRFRDFGFAKACLDRCLKFHPHSSKANHRMGTYFLNVGSYEAVYNSAYYFKIAMEADDNHYPSLCCFVQVLMQRVEQHGDSILDLIADKIRKIDWDSIQLAGLHYLRGLVLFAQKRQGALVAFEQAYSIHNGALAFMDLPYQHRRYCWPRNSNISLDKLSKHWLSIVGTLKGKKKEFVELLISRIDEAIKADNQYHKDAEAASVKRQLARGSQTPRKSDDDGVLSG